ncbi:hypothetical protein C8Q80DRAFT_1357624 [Daedaleopsis nitida]|nr:hypothetical protein C8Q80DRAFT_1357624 [Daedaleopsis nitida]
MMRDHDGGFLLDIPAEVVETILTFCAAAGHPCSVAAVAQTCKRLRSLIYEAPDRYLWRNLFLAVFDDPRIVSDSSSTDFDWHEQFTDRVWAGSYIRTHAKHIDVQKKPHLRSTRSTIIPLPELSDGGGNPSVHARALRALVSVTRTAAPSSPHRSTSTNVTSVDDVISQNPTLSHLHTETPLTPPPVNGSSPSRNIGWLEQTLSNGLPYSLTKLLSYEYQARDWRNMPEGPALCQLTSYLGFLPVPVVEVESGSTSPSRSRKSPRSSASKSGRSRSASEVLDMSESMQRERARDCARPLAFSMRYLSRRRNWGPYLPFPPRPPKPHVVAVIDSMDEGEDDDEDDGNSDEDFIPPDDDTSSSATSEPVEGAPTDANALTRPDQLYPDWTWLAAARIVTEWKLRAHVEPEEIASLQAWDNLRGGAWTSTVPGVRRDESADPLPIDEDEPWKSHERDWAGAEGTWRRLVCWLDYDDLILTTPIDHNSYGAFVDADLEEAWIIVPMSLKIISYSAPTLGAYPDRPTIHVKGEMGGGGWVGNIEANDEDIRQIHGTVSMLPDGSVRWSLTSSAPNSTQDEWASEAVQLGGVGSAMGSLGMWTGAFHEEEDPIGVFWQWRVA